VCLLWPLKSRPLRFTAVFYFVGIHERPAIGSQSNLAMSEVVSIYKCPPNFGSSPPNLGREYIKYLTTFFATSALDTAYLRNEMSHRQTKMLVSIYNVSPKRWPTFRNFWPGTGGDPFAHFDPPFGGHCVATVTVVTCHKFYFIFVNVYI